MKMVKPTSFQSIKYCKYRKGNCLKGSSYTQTPGVLQ